MASTRMRCSLLINFPQPRQFWARGPREEWPGSLRRPLAVKKVLGHAVHAKNDAPESPDERRYALA